MPGQSGCSCFPIFAEIFLKSTLLLCISLIMTFFLKKKSASLRHFILAVFLIALLALPVLNVLHFGWQTDFLPSVKLTEDRNTSDPSSNLSTSRRSERENSLHENRLLSPAKLETTSGPGIKQVRSSISAFTVAKNQMRDLILVLIWAGGLFFLLLRIFLGLAEASRITRQGIQVDDAFWRVLINRFLACTGLTKKIRLKSHQKVGVPLTWGLFRPVILIPSNHDTWSEDQKSSALFHELSHIKRSDFLITLLVRFSLALFWFNPLSWFVFRKMKYEQERACDELVLKTGIKPSTYAANLLQFRVAVGLPGVPQTAFLSLTGRSSFGERVGAILKRKWTFKEVSMKTKIMICATVILAAAIIGTARPSTEAQEIITSSMILGKEGVASSSVSLELDGVVEENQSEESSESRLNSQEKTEEESKKKVRLKKQVVVINDKNGEKIPIEIIIEDEGHRKKIQISKSITIKMGSKGEVMLLGPEGEDIEVSEGKPVRLAVEDGNLELIEGDNVIMLDKDGALSWIEKEVGKDDVHISILGVNGDKILKIGKADTHGWTIKSGEGKKAKEFYILKEGHADIIEEGQGNEKKVYVFIEPGVSGKHVHWVDENQMDESETSDISQKIREKLEALEKEGVSIEEIMDLLDELEKKLKRQTTAHITKAAFDKSPRTFTIIEKKDGERSQEDIYISKDDSKNTVAVFARDSGKTDVIYSISTGGHSREVYEKIVDRLKKELSSELTLEPEFDKESGVIVFKIKGIGSEDFSKEFVHKLTEIIKEEIKTAARLDIPKS